MTKLYQNKEWIEKKYIGEANDYISSYRNSNNSGSIFAGLQE
jgi:hypothetical protein